MMGRLFAQWIVEKLHGKGNVIILGGQAGSSPNENRVKPAMQVFSAYPGIKILDTVYSDWSPVKGKQVMQAMIAKHGHNINAVFSPHGLQVPGAIEAFLDAGWRGSEIPPITSADMNGPMKMAIKYKFPLLDIDYPPAMMGAAMDVALQVLSGAAVPCTYTINSNIVLTHGDETASIPHPDMYVEQHVVPDGPDDSWYREEWDRDTIPPHSRSTSRTDRETDRRGSWISMADASWLSMLRLEGISKSFPGVRALNGVSSGCGLERSTACWAKTVPANQRSSRSSPAPMCRTRARFSSKTSPFAGRRPWMPTGAASMSSTRNSFCSRSYPSPKTYSWG